MDKLHGYYSTIQRTNNKIYYIYMNEQGKETSVTEVSNIKTENVTEFFKDNSYVGIVNKFVKSVGIFNK
jgi:hypothetical protein